MSIFSRKPGLFPAKMRSMDMMKDAVTSRNGIAAKNLILGGYQGEFL